MKLTHSELHELIHAIEVQTQNLANALAVIEATSDDADTKLVRQLHYAISVGKSILLKYQVE